MSLLPLAIVILLTVSTVPVALADKKAIADSDDNPGSLDIAGAQHRHGQRRLIVHRLTTYEAWDTDILVDGQTDIRFLFYVGGKLARAVYVDVSDDGTPYAEIRDWDSSKIVGFAKVWRPDDFSLQIELPKRLIGRKLKSYRWSVDTSFHEDGHPECGEDGNAVISCVDYVPDAGTIKHKLT